MTYVMAVAAGLLGLLVFTAPVSAHHKNDHQGGPARASTSHSDESKHDNDDKTNDAGKHESNVDAAQPPGLHLGQLLHNLTDDQADDVADELDDCTTRDNLRDMRQGQMLHLAHAA